MHKRITSSSLKAHPLYLALLFAAACGSTPQLPKVVDVEIPNLSKQQDRPEEPAAATSTEAATKNEKDGEKDGFSTDAPDAEGFVPTGFTVVAGSERIGLLDGDELPDLVAAIDTPEESTRILLVAFGQPAGGYRRVLLVTGAVGCRGCGGVKVDDSLQEMSLDNRVLSIVEYGGARETWSYTHKYRWQDGAMTLVHYASTADDTVTGDLSETDIDFASGRMTETETPANQPPTKTESRWLWAGKVPSLPEGAALGTPIEVGGGRVWAFDVQGELYIKSEKVIAMSARGPLGKGTLIHVPEKSLPLAHIETFEGWQLKLGAGTKATPVFIARTKTLGPPVLETDK